MIDFVTLMLVIAPLGLAQLHSEGKLNIRGLLIEPIMTIVNLFRGDKRK